MFSLDAFCPLLSWSSDTFFLRFHEWFYLIILSTFSIYITTLDPNRIDTVAFRRRASKKSQKASLYSGKVGTDFNPNLRIDSDGVRRPSALRVQSSDSTLVGGEADQWGLTTAGLEVPDDDRAASPSFLLDTLAIIQALGAIIGCAIDIAYQRGPLIGIPTALLTVFGYVVVGQVGLGALNLEKGQPPKLNRFASLLLALFLVTATTLGVLLSTIPYYIGFGLWPFGALLCLASTAKTTDDKINSLLDVIRPKSFRASNNGTKAEGEQQDQDLHRVKTQARHSPLPPKVGRYIRIQTLILVFGALILTMASGVYLPIALSVGLIAISSMLGIAKNVGRVSGAVTFWLASIVVIMVLLAISYLPLYTFPNAGLNPKPSILLDFQANSTGEALENIFPLGGAGVYINPKVLQTYVICPKPADT
jgi:hypothetical protein